MAEVKILSFILCFLGLAACTQTRTRRYSDVIDPLITETAEAMFHTGDYKGALTGSYTAHPKIDPVSGEMFFIGNALVELGGDEPRLVVATPEPDGPPIRNDDRTTARPPELRRPPIAANEKSMKNFPAPENSRNAP